ncbi:MAG TPA: formyltransferase family protein [Flavobacteriales bacterium]|nr:formyltransferase family protein [Flavobacteriales bacterium]
MKLVMWINDAPNQAALAHKMHQRFGLAGIVVETKTGSTKRKIGEIPGKIYEKLFLKEINASWFGMLDFYSSSYPALPLVPKMEVENINSNQAFEFTKNINPDVVLVSGTRLIREKLLSVQPAIGLLNLHTGLSPYIKGGPNCTNWCIATNQLHLIGNTVMWIDAGIDSGNIVTTELTPLNGDETLKDVHIKVMEHAHALYLKTVDHLNQGGRSNVPQTSVAQGKTYYTRQWTLAQKKALKRNFKAFKMQFNSEEAKAKRATVKTVSIEV